MSEWEEINLGDLTDWFSGGTPKMSNEEFWKGDIPWITAKSLTNIEINNSPTKITQKGLESGSRLAEVNDILLLVRGSGLYNDIPISIVTNPVAFNQDIKCIRIKKEFDIDPYFVVYFLNANKKMLKGILESTGIGAGKFDTKVLQSLKVKIPPKDELKEVVSTAKCIYRKIENLRKQNESLETIAQTLFKHWFVNFEFPNEDGNPYKSSGGEMERSELGEIPIGWHVDKLGNKVETVGGGTPSTTTSEYWENGDIHWYSPTDLTRSKTLFSLGSEKKITRLGLEKSSARLFPKYSLLLTSRATIGEITINTQDACTNQGFITLVPNNTFSVYFLYSWLLTQINLVQQLASGSTFPELSKSTFRNFSFLIPEPCLLAEYNQVIMPVFQKIENNTKQIQSLTKTRDVLLPKLMSGQLRIAK